jgi:nucleoside-diphosphate-sugar epimerase
VKTVLVAGATGVIGEAALAHFATRPDWRAIAVSRRTPDESIPGEVRHLALDLLDAAACRAAAGALGDVTHLVYAAVSEQPGLVRGWSDRRQMQANAAMLRNLLDPLSEAAADLRHVTLLQGAKAYGVHVGRQAPIPAREQAPRDPHENFYWLQEDYVRERARACGFAWTIFRPQVVVGAAWGAAMNPLLAFGAYAALRREEGQRFSWPGGALQLGELTDPELLACAFEWAATAPAAGGEIFNITNGDVFAWREAWPMLADALGVDVGPDEPLNLARYFAERSALWDRIVEREGLRKLGLKQLLGQSDHYADLLVSLGDTLQRPVLLSTIKLRQAGFHDCRDSEISVRRWVRELQDRRLLPRLAAAPAALKALESTR